MGSVHHCWHNGVSVTSKLFNQEAASHGSSSCRHLGGNVDLFAALSLTSGDVEILPGGLVQV